MKLDRARLAVLSKTRIGILYVRRTAWGAKPASLCLMAKLADLSLRPFETGMVEQIGIKPTTSSLRTTRSIN